MLSEATVAPTIPVSDLKSAREFYEKILGLEVLKDNADGPIYKCGSGTALMIYESAGAGTSEGTYAVWNVDDLDAEMKDLRAKGVEFEDYDLPGLKTEGGIATDGDVRSAWFKDPDGNILALGEMP